MRSDPLFPCCAFAQLDLLLGSWLGEVKMLLAGKRGVVFGASSKYSLGFHVAKAWTSAGATSVTIACESEELCRKVELIARKDGWWKQDVCRVEQCDVNHDDKIERIATELGEVDMVLHSVAMSPLRALRADTLQGYTREEFLKTMETSAYSLLAIAAKMRFSQNKGGSITALTFDASRRIVPGYGAMAPAKAALETLALYLSAELGPQRVRINCLSPGPVNTPAARAIPKFYSLQESAANRSALKRDVTADDVASAAVFLASDLSSAITGQVIRVDCGESNSILS